MPTLAERVLAADTVTVCPAASGSVNAGAGKKENRKYSRVSKNHLGNNKEKFIESSGNITRENIESVKGGIHGYTGILVNCLFFCRVPVPACGGTFDNTSSGGNGGRGEYGGPGRQGPSYMEKSTAWVGQEGMYGRRDGTGGRLSRATCSRELSTAELAVYSDILLKGKIRCEYVVRNLIRTAIAIYVRNPGNHYKNVGWIYTADWPISMRIFFRWCRRRSP
jgi:hypothetical protein